MHGHQPTIFRVRSGGEIVFDEVKIECQAIPSRSRSDFQGFRRSEVLLLVMTINQIETAGRKAGFIRQPLADRLRVIFRRGFNFLNVQMDGRWAFYANLPDGRKPDISGADFESLSVFLATQDGKV